MPPLSIALAIALALASATSTHGVASKPAPPFSSPPAVRDGKSDVSDVAPDVVAAANQAIALLNNGTRKPLVAFLANHSIAPPLRLGNITNSTKQVVAGVWLTGRTAP